MTTENERLERQHQLRDLSAPIVDQMVSDLLAVGIAPHEAAQIMILQGSGMLVRSLGPSETGHSLRAVAKAVGRWVN